MIVSFTRPCDQLVIRPVGALPDGIGNTCDPECSRSDGQKWMNK